MLTKPMKEQLKQLKKAGDNGVWCGDLIDKTTTRELVKAGLVENSGGPPSSLKHLYITDAGTAALKGTP